MIKKKIKDIIKTIAAPAFNTEHKNRNTELHSVESLLKKWEKDIGLNLRNSLAENALMLKNLLLLL